MKKPSITPNKFSLRNALVAGIFGIVATFLFATACSSDSDEVPEDPTPVVPPTSEFGPPVTKGQQLTQEDMTREFPLVPFDIYRDGPADPPNHEDLATFAWLEFIALTAEQGDERGLPGGSFASSGSNPNQTVNFQTYHHRAELFPYRPKGEAKAPTPWNSTPDYLMKYKDSTGTTVPFPVPFNNYTNLDEASQIAVNLLFFPSDSGVMNPLNDYQALFEAKVNKASWKYVNDNYTTLNDINPTTYPDGITLPDSTVHVKATWRPLESIAPDKRYKYFQSQAIYYKGDDDAPVADTAMYALVGLHIIHKTPNYPAFIFSTFEHEDNLAGGTYYVPTYEIIDITLPDSVPTYNGDSLYSPNFYPPGFTEHPYAEPNGIRLPLPNRSVKYVEGAKLVPVGDGKAVYAVPVAEPPTTNAMVAAVNARALELMKGLPEYNNRFVWQYYFLKGVQGVPTNDDTTPDFYLANNVTESSQPTLQLFRGGQSIAFNMPGQPNDNRRNELNVKDLAQGGTYFCMGGCQGCHGISKRLNGFDFSFLYFGASSGFNPDTKGIKEREEIERLLLKYKLHARQTSSGEE